MSDRETYRGQFAAYFAGQLSAEGAAALESALSRDAVLAREAEALRPIAAELVRESGPDSADFRLSSDRLALIRAAAAGRIVEFPAAAAVRSSRARVFTLRRFVPALAAAAAVVIGAMAGFSSGRERFDTVDRTWQVAKREAPAADDADSSHYYPPAYGLDHYTSWPSHRPSAVGFASSAPANYGIPGPRPAYLIRGETLLLL